MKMSSKKNTKQPTEKFNINEQILIDICTDISNKSIKAINNSDLMIEICTYFQMQHEYIKDNSSYNVANSIRSYNMWYKNKDKEPINRFVNPREVFFVDLGAFNLKYEEGFVHPCVVLKQYGNSVILIPGSTKSYGKTDKLIFDVQATDGFKENTGVMLDQIRMVSITRLGSKIGKMSSETFIDMNKQIIQKFFGHHYSEYEKLKADNKKLNKKIDQLTNELEQLKKQIYNKNE